MKIQNILWSFKQTKLRNEGAERKQAKIILCILENIANLEHYNIKKKALLC